MENLNEEMIEQDCETEDEFVLSIEDVWLLLDYMDGNELDQDEFNSLKEDMVNFVKDIETPEDE